MKIIVLLRPHLITTAQPNTNDYNLECLEGLKSFIGNIRHYQELQATDSVLFVTSEHFLTTNNGAPISYTSYIASINELKRLMQETSRLKNNINLSLILHSMVQVPMNYAERNNTTDYNAFYNKFQQDRAWWGIERDATSDSFTPSSESSGRIYVWPSDVSANFQKRQNRASRDTVNLVFSITDVYSTQTNVLRRAFKSQYVVAYTETNEFSFYADLNLDSYSPPYYFNGYPTPFINLDGNERYLIRVCADFNTWTKESLDQQQTRTIPVIIPSDSVSPGNPYTGVFPSWTVAGNIGEGSPYYVQNIGTGTEDYPQSISWTKLAGDQTTETSAINNPLTIALLHTIGNAPYIVFADTQRGIPLSNERPGVGGIYVPSPGGSLENGYTFTLKTPAKSFNNTHRVDVDIYAFTDL